MEMEVSTFSPHFGCGSIEQLHAPRRVRSTICT